VIGELRFDAVELALLARLLRLPIEHFFPPDLQVSSR
jgi:hypothetical protein